MKAKRSASLPARLPSVNRVLGTDPVIAVLADHPRDLVVRCVREVLAERRAKAPSNGSLPELREIAADAARRTRIASAPSLRRVINATGIVLHTGLGRSVLCPEAVRAVTEAASSHSSLEIDLDTGRRGSRTVHVRGLLQELTGAEDALVLNNNAGAVFLAVHALAAGKEVVISRGELVEIGGSFRMPDIIRSGGATLVEVGTTNRTRLRDYEEAITDRTGMILRCHTSNFRIVGFSEAAPMEELSALGRRAGLPVVDDLGSGALCDAGRLGIPDTDTLRRALARGADIVTASGDKLLGGPQAGILVGRAEYVRRVAAHPLARALRVDKMTLAALEATLRLYRDAEQAAARIPTLRYLSRTEPELRRMARRLGAAIRKRAGDRFLTDLVSERSQAGGGSLPGEELPTVCVRIRPRDDSITVDQLAERLRQGATPLVARVKDGALLLDPRTMEQAELAEAASAVAVAF